MKKAIGSKPSCHVHVLIIGYESIPWPVDVSITFTYSYRKRKERRKKDGDEFMNL